MLGIVCGIQDEAAIARRIKGARVMCSGAKPDQARLMAEQLVRFGCSRLISFGIAGGLESGLCPGDLFICDRVITKHHTYTCASDDNIFLMHKIPKARSAPVFGSEVLIVTKEEKLSINHTYGCSLVDMESQCVAEVALQYSVPFSVVRVICDGADVALPPELMTAFTPEGSISYQRVIALLFRKPWLFGSFLHLGVSTYKALSKLKVMIEPIEQLPRIAHPTPTTDRQVNSM